MWSRAINKSVETKKVLRLWITPGPDAYIDKIK